MKLLIQILNLHKYPEIWNHAFFIISIFGIYLSFLLIIASRFKSRVNIYLGLYTACLSFILFKVTGGGLIPGAYEKLLDFTGIGSIFCIGPFAYQLIYPDKNQTFKAGSLIHYIPAILSIIILIILNRVNTLAYVSGLSYLGVYVAIISIAGYKKLSTTEKVSLNSRWRNGKCKSAFIIAISISYVLIVISFNIMDLIISYFITSIILSVHILCIWIRLLSTSFNNKI